MLGALFDRKLNIRPATVFTTRTHALCTHFHENTHTHSLSYIHIFAHDTHTHTHDIRAVSARRRTRRTRGATRVTNTPRTTRHTKKPRGGATRRKCCARRETRREKELCTVQQSIRDWAPLNGTQNTLGSRVLGLLSYNEGSALLWVTCDDRSWAQLKLVDWRTTMYESSLGAQPWGCNRIRMSVFCDFGRAMFFAQRNKKSSHLGGCLVGGGFCLCVWWW